ncbi:inorganic triphosphatase [Shewanella aestuarii]|uniref:CYTH domain-containing protein n=1 Tax=Shewanella aestuarii TaxID=1028752 RepID=A0A6G9QG87_9GAMM|nr:CYTH domain-containing protein [Shewanella aestuarii]QIR13554.1 CYTH domain-containing protein [Shewanella aestuarii]
METEIELKLLISTQHFDSALESLSKLPKSKPINTDYLFNHYFDTSQLQLLTWDMGLRVRGSKNHQEQTIKTAGSVKAGIHSRPEYNVPTAEKTPNLALFPQHIWPKNTNIAELNQQLECIFETNFTRITWRIFVDDSLIEVALDQGEIIANKNCSPICEVELELLAGSKKALTTLAQQIAKHIPVRLGQASKAQRGYQLAKLYTPKPIKELQHIKLNDAQSLSATLKQILTLCLERWQQLEAVLITPIEDKSEEALSPTQLINKVQAWGQFRDNIRLLKLTLNQFGLLSSDLHQQLTWLEDQLVFVKNLQSWALIINEPTTLLGGLNNKQLIQQQVSQLIFQQLKKNTINDIVEHINYGQLQLVLVEMLMLVEQQQIELVDYPNVSLLANDLQQDSWKRILQLMPLNMDMSNIDYQQVAIALDESLQVGVAYGELYPNQQKHDFRAPWIDLALGISTLHCYQLLRELNQASTLGIASWLDNKESSLLFAMEHSRKRAVKNKPYW